MILLALCLAGTAVSYIIGVRNPGRSARGTARGWIVSLVIGGLLAATFYAFSALGLLVSLDSLLGDF